MDNMEIKLEKYINQKDSWPQSGQHILAQYDNSSIIVYQAYNWIIAKFASKNRYFYNGFSFNRMSWIKPNFLWMMYRSGWGQKKGQTRVLAIRLKREFFDKVLSLAVYSAYNQLLYKSHDDWKKAVSDSEVRLQWDPDHKPNGEREERRAIQLGLRGEILKEFSREAILNIYDITQFVNEQYSAIKNGSVDNLIMPLENVYLVNDEEVKKRIGL